MISFVLLELIRINIYKKDNNALLAELISMLLIGFGVYLWIKNGLILDYGIGDEIKSAHAETMFSFAIASVLTGFVFILISLLKFMVWMIVKNKRQ